MNFLSQITIFTWLFLITAILTLLGYLFSQKIIFFFAKKGFKFFEKQAYELLNELEQKKLRDKQKRKDACIKRADDLSKATNGRRFYVMQMYDDFVIVDSTYGKKWLRDNNKDPNLILAKECVYYTPVTNLCVNNSPAGIWWLESLIEWFAKVMYWIGIKRY